MLIAGAKGTAKEVASLLKHTKGLESQNHIFFDNVSKDIPEKLFNTWSIITNNHEAKHYFNNVSQNFIIAVGNPYARFKLFYLLKSLGGKPTSYIFESSKAYYEVYISDEAVLVSLSVHIAPMTKLERGVFLNAKSYIGFNSTIGEFTEICPSAILIGNNIVGKNCFIGTKSIIYPNVKIGDNVVVAAGSIVTKDVPSRHLAYGKPANFRKLNIV